MDSINERLQAIVDELFEGNKAKFAKTIGIAPTSVSNYLGDKRQSKPSSDLLEKIINSVGNISVHWLLTGEGNMLAGGSNSIETNGDFSPASMNGDVTVGADAILSERVKSLETLIAEKEALLAEKERLIKVLMEGRK